MFPPHRVPQPAVFNDPPMPPFSHRINGSDYPPTRFPAPRFGHGHPAPFVEENFGGPSRGSFGSRRSASPVFDGDTHRYPDTARPFDHMNRQDALVEVDYSRPRPPQQMHFLGQPQFPTPMDFSGPSRFGTRVAQPLPRPRPFRPILEKPRRFGPPQYDTARARRIALTYFCDVCKVGCGGPKALYDHKNGQRHKKRLSQVEEMERLKSKEKAQAENTATNPRTNEFRCELCNVGCTGTDAFSAHLTGRVHRRTLRLHRALGKPIPSLPDPLDVIKMSDDSDREPPKVETPSTNTGVTHTPTTRPDTTPTQQTAATRTEEKLVGEEYVVAFPAPGGMGVHFRCGLCECQFNNKEAKELHMRGRRHRLQYKKKVDPLLVVEPKQRKAPVKRKVLLGPRPDMLGIPPMPNASLLPSAGLLSLPEPAPFGRFPYQQQEAGIPPTPPMSQQLSSAVENRYIHTKHASIVPTEIEAKAMKTIVSLCEISLRTISDDLMKGVIEARRTSNVGDSGAKTSNQGQSKEANRGIADLQELEGDRLLRGVVRVGPLGKSLLLRGDHQGDLVLDCLEWPTTEVVQFIQTELSKTLPTKDSNFWYTISSCLDTGKVTVVATRKLESSRGTTEPTPRDAWPVITIHIHLTSGVVRRPLYAVSGASGAVEADGSNAIAGPALHTAPEQPSNTNTQSRSPERLMFARGERIGRRHCLEALDAIDQAKWFQSVLVKYPLGIISRVLLDFMRANKIWLNLEQFSLFAFLDRLLTVEIQVALRASGNPALANHLRLGMLAPVPFSPPIRGGAPSFQPSPPITPTRLFRLFFEAISSGILLLLRPDVPTTKIGDDSPNELFFGFKRLAETPIEIREEITVSAQFCLRQIAFRQLHKVLRMEPFSNHQLRHKGSTNDASGLPESEVNGELLGSQDGAVGGGKRRLTDSEMDHDTDDDDDCSGGKQNQSGAKASERPYQNLTRPVESISSTDVSAMNDSASSPVNRMSYGYKRSRRGR
ncbi:unnamed protein product [Dicrocoelium dendriticum]|nr:unnamed protein product [Dicrocoelium dendriticum]